MKRIVLFTFFIFSLLFSSLAGAQENISCQDVSEINITLSDAPDPQAVVQRALANYNESRLSENNYCVVFNIIGGMVSIRSDSRVFLLNVEHFMRGRGEHDIYITGLKLDAGAAVTLPLLTIINNTSNRVFVSGFQMTNVRSGLKLEGSGQFEVRGSTITGSENPELRTGRCVEVLSDSAIVRSSTISNCGEGIRVASNGVEINDSEISGNATEDVHIAGINSRITNTRIHDSPVCVSILGDSAIVKSSTISNCGEGIRIDADNVFLGALDPSAYETDKNTLSGNLVGIHQISGAGNKWPYNSVSGGDGIVVVGGARPVIPREERDLVALACTQPEGTTTVNACEIQFDSLPETGGEVQVYKTLLSPPIDSQGKDYIARCVLAESDKCIFDEANADALISQIMCDDVMRCDFTALQTGASSSMYTESFKLDEEFSTIIMPTGEIPIGGTAGVGGGATDAGGGDTTGGSGPPGESGLYIENNDTGTLLATEQQQGGGGVAQQQVGSLPVSLKACRFTSPDNERAKGVFEMWWWLIFTLPLPYVMRRMRKCR